MPRYIEPGRSKVWWRNALKRSWSMKLWSTKFSRDREKYGSNNGCEGRRSCSKEEKWRSGKGIEKEQRKRGPNEVGATTGMWETALGWGRRGETLFTAGRARGRGRQSGAWLPRSHSFPRGPALPSSPTPPPPPPHHHHRHGHGHSHTVLAFLNTFIIILCNCRCISSFLISSSKAQSCVV